MMTTTPTAGCEPQVAANATNANSGASVGHLSVRRRIEAILWAYRGPAGIGPEAVAGLQPIAGATCSAMLRRSSAL